MIGGEQEPVNSAMIAAGFTGSFVAPLRVLDLETPLYNANMQDHATGTAAHPTIKQRVVFLVLYCVTLFIISAVAIGSPCPTGGGEWVWWVSAVALYLVSTLSAPFFIKPRDSIANAMGAGLILWTIDLSELANLKSELNLFRWCSFGLAVVTCACAVAAIAMHQSARSEQSRRAKLLRLSYRIAVTLGSEAVLFTPPALISIIGFYQQRLASLLWLAAIWIFIIAARPIELMAQLWAILSSSKLTAKSPEYVGRVTRVDDPDIIRVALDSPQTWKPDQLHVACFSGNRHVHVIPLFLQVQDEQLVGTGLCCRCNATARPSLATAEVWTETNGTTTAEVIASLAGIDEPVDLIGFVVEDSLISPIRFEIAATHQLEEGAVVFVRDRNQTIYYQVLNAATKEEMFTQNPRGTHVVVAGQLGIRDSGGAFRKYGWVPPMNGAVFAPKAIKRVKRDAADDSDSFSLGMVGGTGMTVSASLRDMADYHTAILGVTGTGKTELVFDLIEAHIKAGRKVFCVDCTGEYVPRLKARLAENSLQVLGFDKDALDELDELVNAPEFGAYGGSSEKEKLHKWITEHRQAVGDAVSEFMSSNTLKLGVFELPDIANTRATLRATEMYISSVFQWSRANRKARDIVVVLEEAHTVVPEWNLYRHDKADTDAVVGRMSQIALQGRKYGVGMILVSQRTALVSKTLLSQCNTCISFAMYDKTGLEYLESVFATDHVRAIPHLGFLQALAFGKGIKSDRPVIFQIPEDPRKRDASKLLDQALPLADVDIPQAASD